MLKDSPQPHSSAVMLVSTDLETFTIPARQRARVYSLIFGLRNTNRALNLSSCQSISLPIILKSALLSIKTFTPSCSTVSSKDPALSTYSKWYANPEHPLFLTPMRMNLLSGDSNSCRSWETAVGVRVIGALRGRSLLFFGLVGDGCGGATTSACGASCAAAVGLLFCASPSLSLTSLPLSFLSHGADGGQDVWLPELMLVSGVPSFLGGGGTSDPMVCGRHVSVIRGRLLDCRAGRKEEKGHLCALRQWAHRRVAAGWEAKRKMVLIDGPEVRMVAMFNVVGRLEVVQGEEMCWGDIVGVFPRLREGQRSDDIAVKVGKSANQGAGNVSRQTFRIRGEGSAVPRQLSSRVSRASCSRDHDRSYIRQVARRRYHTTTSTREIPIAAASQTT